MAPSTALLFVLLGAALVSADWPLINARGKWLVAFGGVTLLLLAVGGWYYRAETARLRAEKAGEIAAIGDLKAGQIQQWRTERLTDAARTAGGPLVSRAVADFLADPSGPMRAGLAERLVIERTAGGYSDALLLAPDGPVLLSANPASTAAAPATLHAVAAALASREPVLSELFRDSAGVIQLDAVAAVRDQTGRPLAVMVLRSDAATYLYPLIQRWPTPSRSAETFIVRRDGDAVLFLNEARHQPGSALKLRQPLSRTEVPGVQAALGRKGMFEGRDYRGVAVLSDLRPIAGSPWFMAAKVDLDEIFAETRTRTGLIATVVGSLILLGGVATGSIYRQQNVAVVEQLNAELEQRVRKRTTELTAANQELESFSFAVSHDLRAPLRAMIGFSQALIEDYDPSLPSEAREYLRQITLASERMRELVDGLLVLSRCTRGDIGRDPADLSAQAEKIRAELTRAEPARIVEWRIQPGITAPGDARMLEVVLTNLLGNAWKYTARQPHPRIEFGCVRGRSPEQPDSYFVRDNGAGFEMKHAGELFKPFQRLHRQDEFPGIGIGLATAQRILHRHGGTLSATAAVGQGATFSFTLPRSGGPAPNGSAP